MKNIKSFDEQFNTIIDSNINSISENMLLDSDSFNNFMQTDFTAMFEDVILNGTIVLLLEGEKWNKVKDWLKDKYDILKNSIKDFIKKIGQIINDSVLNKFISLVKSKFTELSKDVIQLFDSMKLAVIKHDLITFENKPNFKKITSYVMEIFKTEKNIDSTALNNISNAASGLKLESLFINNDSLRINKNLNFVNASLNEFLNFGKPKTKVQGQESDTEQESDNDQELNDIIQFNVDKTDSEGKNVTREQLANTGIGIFTKLLLKMGVDNPRAQVALTKVSMMLIGIIVSAVIALIVSSGGAIAVTGTAGWAFTGVGFSILTVIAGLFFAFGVFLLMCWFRKPYPSLDDYIEYLEAWFNLYPDGVRKNEDSNIQSDTNDTKKYNSVNNFNKNGHAEGFGRYEENRLKKDDICKLIGKWYSLKRKNDSSNEIAQNIKDVESHIIRRKSLIDPSKTIDMSNIAQEKQVCSDKRKERKNINIKPQNVSNDNNVSKDKMISYKDKETGKYRTGIRKQID